MTMSNTPIKAKHLEGGNFYDDMRIDIAKSHERFDNLLRNPKSIRKPYWRNLINLYITRLAMRLRVHELIIANGIRNKWINDFRNYWSKILEGRPIWNTIEFFAIVHDYRKKQQHTSQLDWGNANQHLANWQHPNEIYAMLHFVRKLALYPILDPDFWKKIPPKAKILEYGCSLAPYYYSYRDFYSHLNCHWTLADIPNYPFHYARYLYRDDAETDFVTINLNDFEDPLGDRSGFDVIILTTVLEHLDEPLFITNYLLKRLNPEGLFIFDYIKEEAEGLDHPNAVIQRDECLKLIRKETELLSGKFDNFDESIGLCIMQKKS